MSEILSRNIFTACLYDETEKSWPDERSLLLAHDAALRVALETATRERDEARICNTIVRERVEGILANWMRPPGGQQAGVPDKSIGPQTCREILRSLGPGQGGYTYMEWRRLIAERDEALAALPAPPADTATEAVEIVRNILTAHDAYITPRGTLSYSTPVASTGFIAAIRWLERVSPAPALRRCEQP